MRDRSLRILRVIFLAALATGGIQFSGCFSTATQYVANYNPCGTILNCSAAQYEFVQSGYDGPGADPDVDPWCTYPPYCSASVDPLLGQP